MLINYIYLQAGGPPVPPMTRAVSLFIPTLHELTMGGGGCC